MPLLDGPDGGRRAVADDDVLPRAENVSYVTGVGGEPRRLCSFQSHHVRCDPVDDGVFPRVDVGGMSGGLGAGAGVAVPAAVAGLTVGPVRLQVSPAHRADHQPDEGVAAAWDWRAGVGVDGLRGEEVLLADQPGWAR